MSAQRAFKALKNSILAILNINHTKLDKLNVIMYYIVVHTDNKRITRIGTLNAQALVGISKDYRRMGYKTYVEKEYL